MSCTEADGAIPPPAPGVAALPEAQLRRQVSYALTLLPDDARRARDWLRRGRLASSTLWPTFVRRLLLQMGGVEIGRSVYGLERCWYQSAHVSIGDGTFIGNDCVFEGNGRIEIGANCLIGQGSMIVTSTHPVGEDGGIARFPVYRDCRIGEGCWLGARAMVMPGVEIGRGAVIAAASVVTSNCESGGVYAGVPARRIR